MKVLIATKQGQGKRKNDFSFAEAGELVTFGSECDNEPIDGGCGCRRSLVGVESRRATTTFQVAQVELTKADLIERLKASLIEGGWGKYSTDAEMTEWASEDAAGLIDIAEFFEVGTVVERRGSRFAARIPATPPVVN